MLTTNTHNQTLFITGASGFIGGHLMQKAATLFKKVVGTCNTNHTHKSSLGNYIVLNITDKKEVESAIQLVKPDIILHCAAISNAEFCAKNKNIAQNINVEGTRYVAESAKKCGAHMIYVSTDMVFDGQVGGYTAQDIPNPVSVYGKTKYDAELAVQAISDTFSVARIAWVYGKSINSAKNYLDYLIENLQQNKPQNLFFNEFRSPIYVEDVCDGLLYLAQNRQAGIHHLAGPEKLSRLDFALIMAKNLGFDKNLIQSVSSDSIPFTDARPKDCSMQASDVFKKLNFHTTDNVLSKLYHAQQKDFHLR